MWPKKPDEKAEDFAYADDPEFSTIRRKLARWTADNVRIIKDLKPPRCSMLDGEGLRYIRPGIWQRRHDQRVLVGGAVDHFVADFQGHPTSRPLACRARLAWRSEHPRRRRRREWRQIRCCIPLAGFSVMGQPTSFGGTLRQRCCETSDPILLTTHQGLAHKACRSVNERSRCWRVSQHDPVPCRHCGACCWPARHPLPAVS